MTNGLGVNFYFGGTSLLIVVGVAMDTVQQVESQLIMRHYDGFSPKSGRIRGRRELVGSDDVDQRFRSINSTAPAEMHFPARAGSSSGRARRRQRHPGQAAHGQLRHPADLHRRHLCAQNIAQRH